MESVWSREVNLPSFPGLSHDIKTDVLIIGGGIAGILCAYMMQNSGIDCVLVEADKICSGITKNTTAKITCQHGLVYDKIIRTYGVDAARLYFEVQSEAVNIYRNMCKEIQCDFKNSDSYVYSVNDRKKIEKEALALEKIGCNAHFMEKVSLPISVKGAVCIENQAQFNPLKFASVITENISIFENTKVQEIKPDKIITNNGSIKADKIVVATHFPFINKHGSYFLKMYQHRSYVIALENVPKIDGMYVDEDKKGLSFREYNGSLLLGGGGHRTGKTGGGWDELRNFVKNNYPEAKEIAYWATQDCITLDQIPYIGQYSKNTPSLYVATGFNKWGMTSAMTAALILKDLVVDKENKYTEIFSPSRSVLHPQLMVNAGEAIAGLVNPVSPRCPHMGCALKYNKQERTWDCSCHGSRFSEEGEIIDNPATDDLKS